MHIYVEFRHFPQSLPTQSIWVVKKGVWATFEGIDGCVFEDSDRFSDGMPHMQQSTHMLG